MGRALRVVACTAVLALAGAGCGGDGGDGGPQERPATQATQASPARAAFVSRMDGICRDANARGRVLNSRIRAAVAGARGAPAQLRAMTPFLREAVALQRATLRRMESVPPPPGDEPRWAAILADVRRQFAAGERVLAAARASDAAAFRSALAEQARVNRRLHGALRAYGFRQCGRGAG